MTDDSATLRAMVERLCEDWFGPNGWPRMSDVSLVDDIAALLSASQASWANEKAELERQRDHAAATLDSVVMWLLGNPASADDALRDHIIEQEDRDAWADLIALRDKLVRHSSRPVSEKE